MFLSTVKDGYRDLFFKTGIAFQWVGAILALGIFIPAVTFRWKLFLGGAIIFSIGMFCEIVGRANVLFWIKVKNYPDLAYDWFKHNNSWRVIEGSLPPNYRDLFPSKEWAGPFHLCVPSLNGTIINIFARDKCYKQTIEEFFRRIQAIEN